MTHKRKKLLVVLAIALLAGGGFAWYRQATATERQVRALLAEVREDEPGLVERWLIKLGLSKDRRSDRYPGEVAEDLAKLGPSAVPALIHSLRDRDSMVRRIAALALGDLGDARAVESLIMALKDADKAVRRLAAEALGKLGDPRGIEFLIAALKDEETRERVCAARALGELGDARAVEPLKALLGDKHSYVREVTTEALKQLRATSEGKPLGGAQDKPFDEAQDKP